MARVRRERVSEIRPFFYYGNAFFNESVFLSRGEDAFPVEKLIGVPNFFSDSFTVPAEKQSEHVNAAARTP